MRRGAAFLLGRGALCPPPPPSPDTLSRNTTVTDWSCDRGMLLAYLLSPAKKAETNILWIRYFTC